MSHLLHDLMTPTWATKKTSYTTRFKPKGPVFTFSKPDRAEVHPSFLFSSLLPLFFFLFFPPLHFFLSSLSSFCS